MNITDLTGLLHTVQLTFISSNNPFGDYYVFDFKRDEKTDWKPGQHGIFTFPNRKITGRSWRAFSVASIPGEGIIRLGTKIPEPHSSFKKTLLNLKPGELIQMRGPFGWFRLKDESTPIVMIAGGIGITPMRALFKQMELNNTRNAVLIYSSKDGYLFKDELEAIAKKDPKISIIYATNREEMQQKIAEETDRHRSNAYYYISGSPKMIKSTKSYLKKQGVSGSRVVTDPFVGY